MLLGISGKAGSGKSTAAAHLCENYGFEELTFAEPLKAGAGVLFGFNEEQLGGACKETVDHRCGLTPREALQRLGDFCRELWPEVFVEALQYKLLSKQKRLVVSDVRFLNEARMLQHQGAVLLRLARPGAGPAGGLPNHVSEIGLDAWPGWDIRLANDGSREELFTSLDRLMTVWL